jgi:hypothetical protein
MQTMRNVFDKISHGGYRINWFERAKIREQIEAWLKSGNIFEGIWKQPMRTPQGTIYTVK